MPTAAKTLRKTLFYIILTLAILTIPVLFYGIVNTMVSLKYETENLNDCISLVTGQNLCLTINIMKAIIALCILIIIGLLKFRKRLLKTS